jgi:hypothetical protein
MRETIRLNWLCWFGHVQRMEENTVPKKVYVNLEKKKTKMTGRPRNRWQVWKTTSWERVEGNLTSLFIYLAFCCVCL